MTCATGNWVGEGWHWLEKPAPPRMSGGRRLARADVGLRSIVARKFVRVLFVGGLIKGLWALLHFLMLVE